MTNQPTLHPIDSWPRLNAFTNKTMKAMTKKNEFQRRCQRWVRVSIAALRSSAERVFRRVSRSMTKRMPAANENRTRRHAIVIFTSNIVTAHLDLYRLGRISSTLLDAFGP